MPPARLIAALPDLEALGVDWSPLTAAVDAYKALLEERRVTLHRLRALEDDRPRAVEGDRKRLARAIRDGKEEPPPRATQKIDGELAGTRRRLDALGEAIAEAEAELVAAVEAGREEWLAEVGERVDADAAAVREALDALEAALARRAEAQAIAAWLRRFPQRRDFRRAVPTVPLRRPNLEPYRLPEVLVALRAHLEPPERPERVPHVPPVEQVWPAQGPPADPRDGVMPGPPPSAA